MQIKQAWLRDLSPAGLLRVASSNLCCIMWGGVAAATLLCGPVAHASYCYWGVATGDWSVPANWGGIAPTRNDVAHIVFGGTALVTQPGAVCGRLRVGDMSAAALQITGGSLTVEERIFVESPVSATVLQSGGSTSAQILEVGQSLGKGGTYHLTGSGQLSTAYENVGDAGNGSFVQSGGDHNIEGTLCLGRQATGNGAYSLSGTGYLKSNQAAYIGYAGTGTFTQSGGYHWNNSWGDNPGLYLGYSSGAQGTYILSGGELNSSSEYVGYSPNATALFRQTGGTNIVKHLSIGTNGRYEFSGGNLTILSGLTNHGVFDGKGSNVKAFVRGIVDLSQGTWENTRSMSLTIATNALVIVCPGANPSSWFGNFSNYGRTHTAGTTLTVTAGQSIEGCGSFNDPVNCQGTITSGGSLHLAKGLVLSGAGVVDMYLGSVTSDDANSSMTGGSLTTQAQNVGYSSAGSFTQSGGTNHVNALRVGENAGSNGTYLLNGSAQLTGGVETIGVRGTGTLIQSGVTNKCAELELGTEVGGDGSYTLDNEGQLSANRVKIGGYGSGSFFHSSGTHSILVDLRLAYTGEHHPYAGGIGTYVLSGTGQLAVPCVYIGYNGIGSFEQSGGTHTIRKNVGWLNEGILFLGHQPGASGAYTLSGTGQLVAGHEYVGYEGTGSFIQSGGTNSILRTADPANDGALTLAYRTGSSGTYTLSGGTLTCSRVVGGAGTSTFNFDGGVLQAAGGGAVPFMALLTTVYVRDGGAIVDSNGQIITIVPSLRDGGGGGGLTKLGSGTLELAGVNTFTGDTTIRGGTLLLVTPNALQDSTLDYDGYGGTLSFGSSTTAVIGGLKGSQSLPLANGSSAAVALSLGGNGQSTTCSGQLSGPGSLKKLGEGTLTLSANNTYLGGTTISAGTLKVANTTGSATGTGAVTVNAGATLAGSGMIAGNVVVNSGGHLAPGASAGVLRLTGDLLLEADAKLDFELGPPAFSDLIAMDSATTLSLNGQQFSDFTFTAYTGFGPGDYTLIDAFAIEGTLGTNRNGTIAGLPASLAVSGDDLVLTVVPEPSTFALLGIGAIGLLACACRRQWQAARAPRERSCRHEQ